MKWAEVRAKYPNAWLVVEAIQFHEEGDVFVGDDYDRGGELRRWSRRICRLPASSSSVSRPGICLRADQPPGLASRGAALDGDQARRMKLKLRDSLLFLPVTLVYRGVRLKIDDVLVDTGSATT